MKILWSALLHRATINNAYAHDDQGDNPGQEIEGLTVSSKNCDCCWHLD